MSTLRTLLKETNEDIGELYHLLQSPNITFCTTMNEEGQLTLFLLESRKVMKVSIKGYRFIRYRDTELGIKYENLSLNIEDNEMLIVCVTNRVGSIIQVFEGDEAADTEKRFASNTNYKID